MRSHLIARHARSYQQANRQRSKHDHDHAIFHHHRDCDRAAIIELIGRLVLVLDARDWDSLGELFTDTVYSDRTSLLGGDR
jgi:hypothetical protein